MQDVNNRGNWEARWGYVGTLLSAQFFCKSKTALKIKTVVGKKKIYVTKQRRYRDCSESANVYCKGPESKYFRFCGT